MLGKIFLGIFASMLVCQMAAHAKPGGLGDLFKPPTKATPAPAGNATNRDSTPTTTAALGFDWQNVLSKLMPGFGNAGSNSLQLPGFPAFDLSKLLGGGGATGGSNNNKQPASPRNGTTPPPLKTLDDMFKLWGNFMPGLTGGNNNNNSNKNNDNPDLRSVLSKIIPGFNASNIPLPPALPGFQAAPNGGLNPLPLPPNFNLSSLFQSLAGSPIPGANANDTNRRAPSPPTLPNLSGVKSMDDLIKIGKDFLNGLGAAVDQLFGFPNNGPKDGKATTKTAAAATPPPATSITTKRRQ